jgi:hypothetical protein
MDSLMCLGPIADFVGNGEMPIGIGDADDTLGPGKPHTCMIAAVGSEKAGAVAILRRGLKVDVMAPVPLKAVSGAWAVHYRPRVGLQGGEEDHEGGEEDRGGGSVEGAHAFVLLSVEGDKTMVLDARGDELTDIMVWVGGHWGRREGRWALVLGGEQPT